MRYKHIFFDLDRTLWDFETNSYETLKELFQLYSLHNFGIKSHDEFVRIYEWNNNELWKLYVENKISQQYLRNERFQRTLLYFGIDNPHLSEKLGADYIEICPKKNRLVPFAFESLNYLKERYLLHIITNGFEQTQLIKLANANLLVYFQQIITSEKAGAKKPNPLIFYKALELAQANAKESIYVGDNLEVDILGCQQIGIDGVYFNPQKISHTELPKFEIASLSELTRIL